MSQRSLAALLGVSRSAIKDRLERAQLKLDRAARQK
jgi:predicted DNA binding protein